MSLISLMTGHCSCGQVMYCWSTYRFIICKSFSCLFREAMWKGVNNSLAKENLKQKKKKSGKASRSLDSVAKRTSIHVLLLHKNYHKLHDWKKHTFIISQLLWVSLGTACLDSLLMLSLHLNQGVWSGLHFSLGLRSSSIFTQAVGRIWLPSVPCHVAPKTVFRLNFALFQDISLWFPLSYQPEKIPCF